LDDDHTRFLTAKLFLEALTCEGAHHKQWYLEQLFREICTDPYVDNLKKQFNWAEGIAP